MEGGYGNRANGYIGESPGTRLYFQRDDQHPSQCYLFSKLSTKAATGHYLSRWGEKPVLANTVATATQVFYLVVRKALASYPGVISSSFGSAVANTALA